ncbi:MAG: TrmH family RNA methyltransferase [Thermoanaerobaculia bacterium]
MFKRFRAAVELHRDEIVVEGPKHLAGCIAAGWDPISVAIREGAPGITALPGSPAVFSETLFRSLSDTVQSQGVMALFARPEADAEALLRREGVHVVLDGIQDPGNAGTIVRLAAAFGASGVIATEGTADLFSPKAIRASAGAALSLPIARAARAQLIELCAAFGIELFAAAAGGAELPSALPSRFALTLGSEGQGVSREIGALATPVGIEMSGAVESLNVGAAAAILLWQIQRSRRGGPRS